MSNDSPTGRAPTAPDPHHIRRERSVRDLFVMPANPKQHYVQVDYSALEIRMLAECNTIFGAWTNTDDEP